MKQMEIQFDARLSAESRDAGIQKAVAHADQVVPEWSQKAYQLLLTYLKEKQGSFMAEDLRQYADAVGFPAPPHLRAFGGVFLKASKEGIIKRISYAPVANVKAHRAMASVWIKNDAA